jgi:hypothetical protein
VDNYAKALLFGVINRTIPHEFRQVPKFDVGPRKVTVCRTVMGDIPGISVIRLRAACAGILVGIANVFAKFLRAEFFVHRGLLDNMFVGEGVSALGTGDAFTFNNNLFGDYVIAICAHDKDRAGRTKRFDLFQAFAQETNRNRID